MFLINPTYTSTREELKENGLQTLRRFLALSYAYPFPTTDVLREPEFNRDRLTVMVHRLDEYGGFWEEVCPPPCLSRDPVPCAPLPALQPRLIPPLQVRAMGGGPGSPGRSHPLDRHPGRARRSDPGLPSYGGSQGTGNDRHT